MKRLCFFTLVLLIFGVGLGGLQAQEPRPSLAVLPLKEEGTKDLGDVSETVNFIVASAFADSGAFRLVERSRVMAALPDLKLQESDPAYRRSMAELGQRLGARYILAGSYFPERNLSNNSVSVTVTLRLVNPQDGTEATRFMETGEGATLGSVLASLRRQLSARAAGVAPAAAPPAPAPVPAAVPAPVAVPIPAPTPVPAAVPIPAPAAAPVPVPVPAAVPVQAPVPPVSAPASVPPAPPAPAPRKTSRALLVLREGSMNGVYFRLGGLPHYGARIEDFEFLPKSLARLFPPEVEVTFDFATRGAANDAALNRGLVKSYQPDTLVVLTLLCRTQSQRSYLVMNKTQIQAELQIDFLAPATLEVLTSRTIQTDFVELKGNGTKFPPALKDQLAKRLAEALPVLPN
jgi:hypothetical protein